MPRTQATRLGPAAGKGRLERIAGLLSGGTSRTISATVPGDTTHADRAQEKITGLIVSGTMRPDDCLPPERELGETLGLSRPGVREAVRSLAAKGLVEVRTGSGTHAREIGSDIHREQGSGREGIWFRHREGEA